MSELANRILACYPALNPAQANLLATQHVPHHPPAGRQVFAEHQVCQGFPLLLEGSIKVVKTTASGREMVLYRIKPGDTCIITSSCLLGKNTYPAQGFAESDLTLYLIPPPLFDQFVREEARFRDFVFSLFAARIAELMQLVEEVAFSRLDQRLARLLLSKKTSPLQLTHQQLADELGSVREIVSRLLNSFARRGLIQLGREQITLLNRAGLEQEAWPDSPAPHA